MNYSEIIRKRNDARKDSLSFALGGILSTGCYIYLRSGAFHAPPEISPPSFHIIKEFLSNNFVSGSKRIICVTSIMSIFGYSIHRALDANDNTQKLYRYFDDIKR